MCFYTVLALLVLCAQELPPAWALMGQVAYSLVKYHLYNNQYNTIIRIVSRAPNTF